MGFDGVSDTRFKLFNCDFDSKQTGVFRWETKRHAFSVFKSFSLYEFHKLTIFPLLGGLVAGAKK